jgi:hypothetical protein
MKKSRIWALAGFLVMSGLLCSGCSTMGDWKDKTDKALASASVAIEKVKNGVEVVDAKLTEVKSAADARIAAAEVELAAKGAPIDDAGQLWDWAKANPFEAAGSGGSVLVLLAALLSRYKRAKAALTAAVDAAEALPPEAAATFKKAASASAHMSPSAAGLIAEIKAR